MEVIKFPYPWSSPPLNFLTLFQLLHKKSFLILITYTSRKLKSYFIGIGAENNGFIVYFIRNVLLNGITLITKNSRHKNFNL